MKRVYFYAVILFVVIFGINFVVLTTANAGDDDPLVIIKWGGIEGDVTLTGYKNWSYATGVSLGVYNDASPLYPQASQSFFDGLTVTKYASMDSTQLAFSCAGAELMAEIKILSLLSSKNLTPVWEMILTNNVISRIASGVNETNGLLMEAIDVNPAEIEWRYYKYDPKTGQSLGFRWSKWDRGSNTVTNGFNSN